MRHAADKLVVDYLLLHRLNVNGLIAAKSDWVSFSFSTCCMKCLSASIDNYLLREKGETQNKSNTLITNIKIYVIHVGWFKAVPSK